MSQPTNRVGARQTPHSQGYNQSIFRSIIQSVGIFLAVQFAIQYFSSGNTTTTSQQVSTGPGSISKYEDRPRSYQPDVIPQPIPARVAPVWSDKKPLDLNIYATSSIVLLPFSKMTSDSLILQERNFDFGNSKEKREVSGTLKLPKQVSNNGTLWAHFFIGQNGAVLDPSNSNYDPGKAWYFIRPLTQILPKKKMKKVRNLLLEVEEVKEDDVQSQDKGTTFASFYHPNFTLSFVPDPSNHDVAQMHPALRSFLQLESTGARDESGANGWYYPILYVNTFWQLKKHMTELNGTTTEVPFHITLNNIPNWQFSIFASVDEGMKINAAKVARGEDAGPGGDGSEFEMFKEVLLDTNIWLLSITGIVSVLHMIFEALAFKNDVAHWRKKKDNIGTSLRTILANVVMQIITFLYLLDNNENTSWMILFSQGMGIAIEAWKVTKTVDVRIRPTGAGSLLPYTIAFEDKHKLSETEKKTQEYDAIAFKYMYIVAVPLLLSYAAYSLYYETHKSWYSFIITTLVGFVYTYGFLMMVPSLYINYRLKSVAHMPGKAMMYKFLNTFIDDLFAFTIKMPTLHRLATLRDDVIFFIYLYQSYVYKVDYSRVNEFGQGGESDDETEAENDTKKQIEKSEDSRAIKASGSEQKPSATRRK